MSAITTLFEATLGPSTELSAAHELVRSSSSCGASASRWWVVDLGVRARLVDTEFGAVPRPGRADFGHSGYADQAPLHLRIEAGLADGRSGSSRSWLVDATGLRAHVFASTLNLHLLGPPSLAPYTQAGDDSYLAARDLFVHVSAGIWPSEGGAAATCNCTLRIHVPADEDAVAVPIPAGARTLTIYDGSGSSSPWVWQQGEAGERTGRIRVVDGQSLGAARVPNYTHVAPAQALAQPRDVLLVFGVELSC